MFNNNYWYISSLSTWFYIFVCQILHLAFIFGCRQYGMVTSGGLFLSWLLFVVCGLPEMLYWIHHTFRAKVWLLFLLAAPLIRLNDSVNHLGKAYHRSVPSWCPVDLVASVSCSAPAPLLRWFPSVFLQDYQQQRSRWYVSSSRKWSLFNNAVFRLHHLRCSLRSSTG